MAAADVSVTHFAHKEVVLTVRLQVLFEVMSVMAKTPLGKIAVQDG